MQSSSCVLSAAAKKKKQKSRKVSTLVLVFKRPLDFCIILKEMKTEQSEKCPGVCHFLLKGLYEQLHISVAHSAILNQCEM